MCGELGSYSDACRNIILPHHNDIYNTVKNGINKHSVCMLSGMCSEAFHPHADKVRMELTVRERHCLQLIYLQKYALMDAEISNSGKQGRIEIQKPKEVSDEFLCEFSETLVKQFRNVLVANTTEGQFSDILKGLCKQTGAFSNEVLSKYILMFLCNLSIYIMSCFSVCQ